MLDSLKQAIVPLGAIYVRHFDCNLLLDLAFRIFLYVARRAPGLFDL